ncbi:hypothetical protein MTR67_026309 [Solanum verrucosum]|uniref:Reverse transcriptase RNase H-like domain-containing protein n=1 Tax=Solanum verrucosum TaxID=315347 RepID=A0AAF0QYP2_SOLVR|nr:hypothetical protein MTR67_026309 [Solanum verrucosum]
MPEDFVVLNFEPDLKVPFIRGRPFLATGRAMIDVAADQLTMRVHDKVEVFEVYKALKLLVVYAQQLNYTVTEKKMLALVCAFDKFWSYLVGTKDVVYTDHVANKYLFNKKVAKLRVI